MVFELGFFIGKLGPSRVAALIKRHNIDLVSIGNGTASRETDRLAALSAEINRLTSQAAQPVV